MLKNQLKTFTLLAFLTALLLYFGNLIGGFRGLFFAGIFVVIMNFGSYFYSDKIVLAMYRAKKITEAENQRLYRIVKELSQLARMPMPKLYIIPSEQPNAFATGRNKKHAAVACTAGILKLLSDEELKGVIAHELSHIKNKDTLIQTIASTIAGIISFAASMIRFSAIFGGYRDDDNNFVGLLIMAIITPIIAALIQFAISRSREFLADESAAKLLRSSTGLVSALKKLDSYSKRIPMQFATPATESLFIVSPISAKGITRLLSTHPPMKDRIKRLMSLKLY